jgi:hypothetical protein
MSSVGIQYELYEQELMHTLLEGQDYLGRETPLLYPLSIPMYQPVLPTALLLISYIGR